MSDEMKDIVRQLAVNAVRLEDKRRAAAAGGGESSGAAGGESSNAGGGASLNAGGGESSNAGGGASLNAGGGESSNAGGGASLNAGGGEVSSVVAAARFFNDIRVATSNPGEPGPMDGVCNRIQAALRVLPSSALGQTEFPTVYGEIDLTAENLAITPLGRSYEPSIAAPQAIEDAIAIREQLDHLEQQDIADQILRHISECRNTARQEGSKGRRSNK